MWSGRSGAKSKGAPMVGCCMCDDKALGVNFAETVPPAPVPTQRTSQPPVTSPASRHVFWAAFCLCRITRNSEQCSPQCRPTTVSRPTTAMTTPRRMCYSATRPQKQQETPSRILGVRRYESVFALAQSMETDARPRRGLTTKLAPLVHSPNVKFAMGSSVSYLSSMATCPTTFLATSAGYTSGAAGVRRVGEKKGV